MTLTFSPPDVSHTIRALLYGPPGVGKSTAALTAPGPILLLNLEGPDASRWPRKHHAPKDIREIVWRGKVTLREAYVYAADPANEIKTVVVDSVGELHSALLMEMLKGRSDLDRPSLPMYGDANTIIEQFVRALLKMPDMNLVLVCHEQLDVTDEGPIRMPQTGGKQLPAVLIRWLSVVGYCGRLPTGERVAQFTSAGGRYGKSRLGEMLGEFGPVDIEAWIEALKNEQDHLPKEPLEIKTDATETKEVSNVNP